MQVSQIAESDTHAVLGGGVTRSFSMSQSPEFFTILSNTLYRDKILAVVREVVCNGWDAHLMLGKSETPLNITLTDSAVTIQDYGPGIHDNMMAPIYCRYGDSTKVEDEKQNGGFGLGSKAPFAYSDHFTVTSCHEGTKSVYAVSRTGMDKLGVPDLRLMVSSPTEETGITVTVPIKKEDKDKFHNALQTVITRGGINAVLNNHKPEVFPVESIKKFGIGFLDSDKMRKESIFWVLYGSVMYPVTEFEDVFPKLTRMTSAFLQEQGESFYQKKSHVCVLYAPPNSVGPTPSREALSMTSQTIENLKAIDLKVSNDIANDKRKGVMRVAKKVAENINSVNDLNMILKNIVGRHQVGFHYLAAKEPGLERVSECIITADLRQESQVGQISEVARLAVILYCKRVGGLSEVLRFVKHKENVDGLQRHEIINLFLKQVMRSEMKLIRRAVFQADCLDSMRVVSLARDSSPVLSRLNAAQSIIDKTKKAKVFQGIVIGPSATRCLSHISGYRPHTPLKSTLEISHQDQDKKYDDSIIVMAVVSDNDQKLRKEIREKAEKIGLEVIETKSLPRIPPKNKPKDAGLKVSSFPAAYDFVGCRRARITSNLVTHHLTVVGSNTLFKCHRPENIRSLAVMFFPNTAIVRSLSEIKDIGKTKSVKISDELEKLLKNKRSRYKIAIASLFASDDVIRVYLNDVASREEETHRRQLHSLKAFVKNNPYLGLDVLGIPRSTFKDASEMSKYFLLSSCLQMFRTTPKMYPDFKDLLIPSRSELCAEAFGKKNLVAKTDEYFKKLWEKICFIGTSDILQEQHTKAVQRVIRDAKKEMENE
jgi:hypothetical protein